MNNEEAIAILTEQTTHIDPNSNFMKAINVALVSLKKDKFYNDFCMSDPMKEGKHDE